MKIFPTYTVLGETDESNVLGVPAIHIIYRLTTPAGIDVGGITDYAQKGNTIFKVTFITPLNSIATTKQIANYVPGFHSKW